MEVIFLFQSYRGGTTNVPLYFFKGNKPRSVKLGKKSSWPAWLVDFQNLSPANMFFPYALVNEPMPFLGGLTKGPVYYNDKSLGKFVGSRFNLSISRLCK